MAADWLQSFIAIASELPTIEGRLSHFFQLVHNELSHGKGTTNPVEVGVDLLDATDELVDAVVKPVVEPPGSAQPSSADTITSAGTVTSDPMVAPPVEEPPADISSGSTSHN